MKEILQTGCLISGILCFVYFVSIVCYTGLSEWFMWIWVVAGAGFLMQWRLLQYGRMHPESLVPLMTKVIFLLMLVVLLLIIWFGSKVISGMTAKPQENLDYVIVLGARVRDDQPTRALRKRLDRAMEYAKENPDTILILSGGQGPDEGISEAQCMYNYMEAKGMDTSRILLEDQSTSTEENMRFSSVFLEKEKDRIGIVSNNFHIYRALLLAQSEGYQRICGIPASSDVWMQPHYILREICALIVLQIKHDKNLTNP